MLPYTHSMIIRSIRHRGLSQLLEHNNPRFLRKEMSDRIRKVLTVLILTVCILRITTDG